MGGIYEARHSAGNRACHSHNHMFACVCLLGSVTATASSLAYIHDRSLGFRSKTMSGLSLQAKRWRTIIVTVPIIGATSRECCEFSRVCSIYKCVLSIVVLYQRLVQGKPQRRLPQKDDAEGLKSRVIELKPENITSK